MKRLIEEIVFCGFVTDWRLAVGPQVDAVLALELVGEPVHDALVPVVAAQVCIAVGRLHLEDALADLQDRHIERTAAQIEDQDRLGAFLVQAVGER